MLETIRKTAQALELARKNEPLISGERIMPDKEAIIMVIDLLQSLMFPGYFGRIKNEYSIGHLLSSMTAIRHIFDFVGAIHESPDFDANVI